MGRWGYYDEVDGFVPDDDTFSDTIKCETCAHAQSFPAASPCCFCVDFRPMRVTGSRYKRAYVSNGDSVRSMNDVNLAEFLYNTTGCPTWVDKDYECPHVGCSECWFAWLKKEKK